MASGMPRVFWMTAELVVYIKNLEHIHWVMGYHIQKCAFAWPRYRIKQSSMQEAHWQSGIHTFPVDPQERPCRFPFVIDIALQKPCCGPFMVWTPDKVVVRWWIRWGDPTLDIPLQLKTWNVPSVLVQKGWSNGVNERFIFSISSSIFWRTTTTHVNRNVYFAINAYPDLVEYHPMRPCFLMECTRSQYQQSVMEALRTFYIYLDITHKIMDQTQGLGNSQIFVMGQSIRFHVIRFV